MSHAPRLLLALLVLSCFGSRPQAAAGDGTPRDPNIRFVGRWDTSAPDAPHSYWGGAYLRTGFTGSSLSIKLGKAVDIAVFIDSKPAVIKRNPSVIPSPGMAFAN